MPSLHLSRLLQSIVPRYEHRIHINAAPPKIWAAWSDIASWPTWTPTIVTAEPLGDGPFAFGKQARLDVTGAGDGIFTVTALEEGRRFAWENDYRGVYTIAGHAVEAEGDGSAVILSVEMSGIMAVVFRPLIGHVATKNPHEAEGLERHCESH